jgi:hypothetical protein
MPDRAQTGVATSPPAPEAEEERFAWLAQSLWEFDQVLADEVRQHIVARLEEWTPSPFTTPERAERVRRYQLLSAALRR